jgi:hypothetical protein
MAFTKRAYHRLLDSRLNSWFYTRTSCLVMRTAILRLLHLWHAQILFHSQTAMLLGFCNQFPTQTTQLHSSESNVLILASGCSTNSDRTNYVVGCATFQDDSSWKRNGFTLNGGYLIHETAKGIWRGFGRQILVAIRSSAHFHGDASRRFVLRHFCVCLGGTVVHTFGYNGITGRIHDADGNRSERITLGCLNGQGSNLISCSE